MPDDTTTQGLGFDPADPAALDAIMRLVSPPVPQRQDSGAGRSIVGLLGQMAGAGGATGGEGQTDEQYNANGRNALLNFGLSMLQGSTGYQAAPRSFLHTLANSVGAANQAYTGGEALGAAQDEQQYKRWQDERQARVGALGEVGKLQQLRLALARLQAAQNWPVPGQASAAPPTSIGAVGAAPGSDGTPEGFVKSFLPVAQAISGKTGIPVETVVGQAAQETGWGKSMPKNNWFGIGVTGGKTPGYDTPEAGAQAYVDLVNNDRYKGVPRDQGPGVFASGLQKAGYNGDTNYGAGVAGTTARVRQILGQNAPPAGPGQAAIPPPAPVQVAGPGAPVSGATPAPPPVSGLGAPGQATGPAPGSFEAHLATHPAPPPPAEIVNADVTPEQKSNFATQLRDAQAAVRAAQSSTDPGKDYPTAMAKYNEVVNSQTTAIAEARQKAADRLAAYNQNWVNGQREIYQKGVDAQNTDEQNRKATVDALNLRRVEGDETRKTAAAASENSYVLDQRQKFAAAQDASRDNLAGFDALKALSEAAKTSTPLDNLDIGNGRTGRDLMVQMGLGTDAQRQKWGAQQAFEAALNKTIINLRQGVSMGALSDRDMNFLQHLAPAQTQDPQTRSDIIAYLQQAEWRKKSYMDTVEKLWDGGHGMSWGAARTEAEKSIPDIVPNVPDNFSTLPTDQRRGWLGQNNIKEGSLVRLPNGNLARYRLVPQQ